MRDRSLANFLVVFAIFFGPCALYTEQAKDTSAPAAASDSSGNAKKGDAGQASAAPPAAGDSGVCTVNPGSGTSSADGGAKGGGGNGSKGKNTGTGTDSSSSGTGVQVNQYAAAGAPAKQPAKTTKGEANSKKAVPSILSLDPGNTNAGEIAPRLTELDGSVISATAIDPTRILVVLDNQSCKDKDNPVCKRLKEYVSLAQKPDPHVFVVTLDPGTRKACDIAHALVNAIPGISEITALDDSRLLVTASNTGTSLEDRFKGLVPSLAEPTGPTRPTGPGVGTIVQRLYYNHDPLTVATIINAVYPNVKAQAMRPDLVVLSDVTDVDDAMRDSALKSAQRTIARIDQPHPQVSVDAWSLQLATTEKKGLGTIIPRLEDLAGAYNQAINESLSAGWNYLAGELAICSALDPLLRSYLTSSTQVDADRKNVTRLQPPCVLSQPGSKTPESKTDGYGLGFTTLYYPLTPNLIDMLVALASLQHPRVVAEEMFHKMGTTVPRQDNHEPCRARDKAAYGDTPPENLQLGCVRDVLMGDLFAPPIGSVSPATSSLGQFRGALADFLFHYKLMVEYPEDFHAYREPIAADTLDSALVPVVAAFDEDLSVFQASLQAQVAKAIGQDKKTTYGYGGLVTLKVLSAQAGAVKTATQNYFDATPPATLNDFLTNLQAAGAGAAKSPLSSIMTGLVPEKAAAEEAVAMLTALSQTLTPKTTTAHLGRGLDLDVTAHTLSGAIGAELDLSLKSTENGAGLIKAGSDKPTDDLNSRVSQHTVDTHVRLDSINLFRLSTLSATLVRGRAPWKPFDPIEVPLLGLLVKKPRSPDLVYTQSLAFVDAIVVPTAADLGYGVPITGDRIMLKEGYKDIKRYDELSAPVQQRILDYHERIVDCLNREYVGGTDGAVHVARGGKEGDPCSINEFSLQ